MIHWVFSLVTAALTCFCFWAKKNAGGIGRINKDGVDYYHRLINYMLANRKDTGFSLSFVFLRREFLSC